MRGRRRSLVGGFGALALAAGFLGAAPPAQAAVSSSAPVVINEVYGGGGNSGATYTRDFVELYNTTDSPFSLVGWSVQYASATGAFTNVDTLEGTIPPHSHWVVAEAAGAGGTVGTPNDEPAPGNLALSGTGGKVLLARTTTAQSTCGTACATAADVVDLVGWGLSTTGSSGAPAPGTSNTTSVSRDARHTNTTINAADFAAGAPTPGTTPDDAPRVLATTPADGAGAVAESTNLTVTFSEDVTLTDAFGLVCAGADQAFTLSGSGSSYTLDPTSGLPADASCALTVRAAGVADTDPDDPPDHPTADRIVAFSTGNVCTSAYTHAYEIQGSGDTAAITGAVTTQGVVVGDYEGPSPTLRGFYLQDAQGDGDPTTSDAVFVFNGSRDDVHLGDVVRVNGTAADFQDQTQVSASSVVACGTGTVAPTDVTLPFASASFPERYEGMLVRMAQTLYVTEHFQLGRFGQVLMSSGGRLQQPTSVVAPGAPAQALQAQNDLNQILFDDDLQNQNPDPIRFGRGGQPLSASNTLRGGDTATDTVGVMTYTWAGNGASGNAWRLRPIGALGGGAPDFQAADPRPSSAPQRAAGTDVRVAGMNLLNFFNTFSGCTNGVGGAATDCRGADTQLELDRQWPKTVAGIVGTGADVIGINEIENDGYGPASAIRFLVDKLNVAAGPGTYAFVDVDASTGQTNAAGTDAIKVGVLYKPAVVTPVGTTAVLNTDAFVNGGDSSPRSRPSIAQAFEDRATGARFVLDVNHLKSKGSACEVPDSGDGSGNCNAERTRAAQELAAWLATDPTGTADPDVLLVGDYNSYARETPVTTLEDAGYSNLIRGEIGDQAYSYVFDGQWGYLDYAFGTASLQAQLAGVHEWHINADEPSVLDYNTDFKTAHLQSSLYAPDEFRISDHDPVLVDLDLTVPFDFAGFFRPVENAPTVNTVKAGSAVPVRFGLGGDRGLDPVATARVVQLDCGTGLPTGVVTPAAANGLTYDATSGTYTYTWKTQKGWAGTCGRLVLALSDHSGQVATFRFT